MPIRSEAVLHVGLLIGLLFVVGADRGIANPVPDSVVQELNDLPRQIVARSNPASELRWIRLLMEYGFEPQLMRGDTRAYVRDHCRELGPFLLASIDPDSGCVNVDMLNAVHAWDDQRLQGDITAALRRWLTDVKPVALNDPRSTTPFYVARCGGFRRIGQYPNDHYLLCDLHSNQVDAAELLWIWNDRESLPKMKALLAESAGWTCEARLSLAQRLRAAVRGLAVADSMSALHRLWRR